MTKPTEHALKAAREIIYPVRSMRDDFCESPGCRCGGLRDIEAIATRIDAAAEAIVRERLAALHKLEEEWRKYLQDMETIENPDTATRTSIYRVTEAASALRDALKGLVD